MAFHHFFDGTSRGGNFTPRSISGLVLYVRSDVGTFQDSAMTTPATAADDPVGGWRDQSGQGNHLIQATSTKRPLLKHSIWGTRPALLWDATDDCLQRASFGVGVFTVFSVFKLTGTAGLIYEQSANAGAGDGFYLHGTTGASILSKKGANASGKDRAANWAVDDAKKVVTHRFDGDHAGHTLRINGTSQSMTDTASIANPGTSTITDTLNVGSRNNGASLPISGHIAALVIYNAALTAAQVAQVETYLNQQFPTY